MPSGLIGRALPCQCLMEADRMQYSNKKNAQRVNIFVNKVRIRVQAPKFLT